MGGGNYNDVVGGSGGGIPREGKCSCCNIMNCGFMLLNKSSRNNQCQKAHILEKRLYVWLKGRKK